MNSKNQTVIILHGWGHNANLWQNMKKKLENTSFSVILDDLPGFGSRAGQSVNYSIQDYACWFEYQYKEIINKDKIILVGHSLGGRIAIELAQSNPKWLEKLILIGAPGIYKPSVKTKLLKNFSFLKKLPLLRSLASKLNPEYESAKQNHLKKTYQKVVGNDQKSILYLIQIPTLLIWGDKDLIVPFSIAKEMNKLIVNSELKIVPNSGHSLHLDSPNLLFGILNNYINK